MTRAASVPDPSTEIAAGAAPGADPVNRGTRMARWAARLGIDGLEEAGTLYPLFVLFALNAVDELDISAFAILAPDVRDAFGLSNSAIGGIVALVAAINLLFVLPAGVVADRVDRVRLARCGAAVWAGFVILTGFAPVIGILILARIGSGLGKSVNAPAHRSLLADYYPPRFRSAAYSTYELANPLGKLVAPMLIVVTAALGFGWRVPFVLLAVPTVAVVLVSARLHKPARGRFEREAAGAVGDELEVEEAAPTFAESFRIYRHISTLKRVWFSLPFIVGAAAAVAFIRALYYEDVFQLGAGGRAVAEVVAEIFGVFGLVVGAPIAARMLKDSPRMLFRLIVVCTFAIAAAFAVLAMAPVLAVAVVATAIVSFFFAVSLPALYTVLSMVLPPRARSLGFSIGSLFVIPGLLAVPVAGAIADQMGFRWGIAVMIPVLVVGGLTLASGISTVERDIAAVEEQAAARAASRGRWTVENPSDLVASDARALLRCRGVDAAYGPVQVLFDVDLDIYEGEILALLGTNGAGKSTVLKVISGLLEPTGGHVYFRGDDITGATPRHVVDAGIVQMPGGRSVFPTLTVAESLRLAGWIYKRSDPAHVERATEAVLEFFPILRERGDQLAGDLSGGEQQMLGLAMAFISKPKLLMIDELSLGLAPVVVGQLVEIVRRINAAGTTVVLVEQSVNVALTLAQRALFMEKGEVRFEGRTAELLERGDLLRSVFLEGAGSRTAAPKTKVHRTKVVDRTAQPLLRAQGLVKRFGGITATDSVSFELYPGEILGIIGPNGAGKTTLFDLVGGYLDADEGSVELLGQDVTGWSADRRAMIGLGRSFQDARLFPSLTVAENLALGFERHLDTRDMLAATMGLPASTATEHYLAVTVYELIDLLGLGAFTHKFVSELSTGTRRIVDIGMSLAHRPDVLILDEPSSGIAQRETEALGPLLQRIHRDLGCSLLVIEHDMPLLLSISDRLLALETGRLIADGPPDVVVNDPLVVASYLDTDRAFVHRSGVHPNGADGSSGDAARPRRRPLAAPGRQRGRR